MAVSVWSLGYLLTVLSQTESEALMGLRIVYFGASLIPILTFHFVTNFLYKSQQYKFLIILGYILGLIFLYLTVFTSTVITGARYMENFGSFEEVEIALFIPFLIYFLFFSLLSIILLFISFLRNDGLIKRQSFYLALALIIGFTGGIANFVTDLTGIYPYGQMIVWLYPVLITYGIFTPLQIKITRS